MTTLLRVSLFLALLAAALAPGRAAAQARDTIRVRAAPADTIGFGADSLDFPEDTIPSPFDRQPSARERLPSRWATPFAVRSSGRPEARRVEAEVVWLDGSAARQARRGPASADESVEGDSAEVVASDEEDADTDSAEAPPARQPPTRTASRDTASAADRPTRTTARRDTASAATRTTASRASGSASGSAATSAGSGSRPRTHTVAAGETFYGIARRYGVTSAQLRALNPDVDWQSVRVGEVLRLPARARAPSGSTPPGNRSNGSDDDDRPASSSSTRNRGSESSRGGDANRSSSSRRRTHTVARGETLFGIARRYEVSVDALRRANDLDGDGVRTGQTLVIPPSN